MSCDSNSRLTSRLGEAGGSGKGDDKTMLGAGVRGAGDSTGNECG
jgi:hypothetical protein